MVRKIASLSRSGLTDWVIQRVSALLLTAYIIFLAMYFALHGPTTYWEWKNLFHYLPIKFFTLLALLSLIAHSWIGIWTVLTDYVHPAWLRAVSEVFLVLSLIVFLGWGIHILWWSV